MASTSKPMAMEKLIQEPRDVRLCDALVTRIEKWHKGNLQLDGLNEGEQIVLLVYNSSGAVMECGFEEFVTLDFFGDGALTKTISAYRTIQCPQAADILAEAVAMSAGSARKNAPLDNAWDYAFYQRILHNLATYIRQNTSWFSHLNY